jgi:hypothetical protein
MSYRRYASKRIVAQKGSCWGLSCYGPSSHNKAKDRCPCQGANFTPCMATGCQTALEIAQKWLTENPEKVRG